MDRAIERLKISIVTVVLDSVDLINKTLESVTQQTYSNLEYIILDGGSTDGTIEMIKKYINKINFIIVEPDKGIYDAMNKSLKLVTGDYLLFMNAGDTFYSEETVSKVVDKISVSDSVSVYYGNALSVSDTGDLIRFRGGQMSKFRLARTNICHQTIFYPKVIYNQYSYDLRFKLNADWVYNMIIFRKVQFSYLDEDVAIYNLGGLSSLKTDDFFKKSQIKLIVRNLGLDVMFYLVLRRIYNMIKNIFVIF